MPNRIIKESICTSPSIDGLSWFEEVFFYRLIVNCDDYGRFDGRIPVLKGRLFPLKDTTAQQIESALSKLVKAGMVTVYEYDHRPYLQLENWGAHQTIRCKKSRYPDPKADASRCKQMHANVPVIQSNPIQSESVSESVSNPNEEEAEGRARDWNAFGEAPERPPTDTVEAYLMANLAYMSTGNIEELDALEAQGATPELIRFAVDTACAAGANNWKYVKTVLTNWLQAHITTVAAAKAEQEAFKAGKARAAPGRPSQPALSRAEQFMELARRYESDES